MTARWDQSDAVALDSRQARGIGFRQHPVRPERRISAFFPGRERSIAHVQQLIAEVRVRKMLYPVFQV